MNAESQPPSRSEPTSEGWWSQDTQPPTASYADADTIPLIPAEEAAAVATLWGRIGLRLRSLMRG